jgi:hypothetical protein
MRLGLLLPCFVALDEVVETGADRDLGETIFDFFSAGRGLDQSQYMPL